MGSLVEFDVLVAQLKKLGEKDIGNRIAKKAEPVITKAVQRYLSAKESPNGKPWVAAKKSGVDLYAHAAQRLDSAVTGDVIRLTMTGPEVFTQYGTSKLPKRPMLPYLGGSIPDYIVEAIQKGAEEVLAEVMA